MNTKITPIDKKNGIRGEWSVYNSEKNTRLNFTVQFVCESHFQRKQVQTPRTQPNNNKLLKSWKFFFILLFLLFLQLFYIVGCFFSSSASSLCLKSHKNVLEKITMKNLSIYIFFSCGSQHEQNNFFIFAKETTRFQRADECSNWRLYGKIQENEDEEKYTIFFLYFFLSLLFFHLTSAFLPGDVFHSIYFTSS